MNKKQTRIWLILFFTVFFSGIDTAAAEYPDGTTRNASVGVTFIEEQEIEKELSITEVSNQTEKAGQLPKTGENRQTSYLLFGFLCLFFALTKKKGEPE